MAMAGGGDAGDDGDDGGDDGDDGDMVTTAARGATGWGEIKQTSQERATRIARRTAGDVCCSRVVKATATTLGALRSPHAVKRALVTDGVAWL